MHDARQLAYLQAMGIDCWVRRDAVMPPQAGGEPIVEADVPAAEPTPSAAPAVAVQPRESADISTLDWPGLQQQVGQCRACGLCQSRSQTVFGVGNPDADLLVIGEAPGAEEDRRGEPFVGRAGQLLDAMLAAIGLDRSQVYIANVLKCRPPQNRNPAAEEIAACRPYLQRQIELIGPKLILSLGGVSAHSLLDSDEPVGKLRGREHRHQGIPLRVSYHPAYLLRRPADKAKAWQDLQAVARQLGGQG